MENENQTFVTEFILIGLSTSTTATILLFILFLLMYIMALFGNIILISVVVCSPNMHTPMYFFLCNLSFVDLFHSSNTVPKMLVDMFFAPGRISVIGCMLQMCVIVLLLESQCLLLAVMAFDRYVAICHPLRYRVIMSWKSCKNIMVIIWAGSFLTAILPTITKPPVFCKGNKIDHFLCDVLPLVKLVCGDTSTSKKIIFFNTLFTMFVPFAFIVGSYICILLSVLNIHSLSGRTKALSTCASHLTVVLLFYGTIMAIYLGPTNHFTSNHRKYFAIVYYILTPTLNPLIYSLRNNEVKSAVRRIFDSKLFHPDNIIYFSRTV